MCSFYNNFFYKYKIRWISRIKNKLKNYLFVRHIIGSLLILKTSFYADQNLKKLKIFQSNNFFITFTLQKFSYTINKLSLYITVIKVLRKSFYPISDEKCTKTYILSASIVILKTYLKSKLKMKKKTNTKQIRVKNH